MPSPLYNSRWRKRRAAQLSAEPFCAFCLSEGVYTPAIVADHIEPHRGDLVKFAGPLQSLCKRHHDRDKQLIELGRPLLGIDEDGWPNDPRLLASGGTGTLSREFEERRFPTDLEPSAIPLTVVCGRPGSGKSTYVRERASPGDRIIDLDAIMAALSGLPEHHTDKRWLRIALDERNRQLRALSSAKDGRAWFIVAASDPADRKAWAKRLGGKLVTMETPLAECVRRIKADPSRAGMTERMIAAATAWGRPEGGYGKPL